MSDLIALITTLMSLSSPPSGYDCDSLRNEASLATNYRVDVTGGPRSLGLFSEPDDHGTSYGLFIDGRKTGHWVTCDTSFGRISSTYFSGGSEVGPREQWSNGTHTISTADSTTSVIFSGGNAETLTLVHRGVKQIVRYDNGNLVKTTVDGFPFGVESIDGRLSGFYWRYGKWLLSPEVGPGAQLLSRWGQYSSDQSITFDILVSAASIPAPLKSIYYAPYSGRLEYDDSPMLTGLERSWSPGGDKAPFSINQDSRLPSIPPIGGTPAISPRACLLSEGEASSLSVLDINSLEALGVFTHADWVRTRNEVTSLNQRTMDIIRFSKLDAAALNDSQLQQFATDDLDNLYNRLHWLTADCRRFLVYSGRLTLLPPQMRGGPVSEVERALTQSLIGGLASDEESYVYGLLFFSYGNAANSSGPLADKNRLPVSPSDAVSVAYKYCFDASAICVGVNEFSFTDEPAQATNRFNYIEATSRVLAARWISDVISDIGNSWRDNDAFVDVLTRMKSQIAKSTTYMLTMDQQPERPWLSTLPGNITNPWANSRSIADQLQHETEIQIYQNSLRYLEGFLDLELARSAALPSNGSFFTQERLEDQISSQRIVIDRWFLPSAQGITAGQPLFSYFADDLVDVELTGPLGPFKAWPRGTPIAIALVPYSALGKTQACTASLSGQFSNCHDVGDRGASAIVAGLTFKAVVIGVQPNGALLVRLRCGDNCYRLPVDPLTMSQIDLSIQFLSTNDNSISENNRPDSIEFLNNILFTNTSWIAVAQVLPVGSP